MPWHFEKEVAENPQMPATAIPLSILFGARDPTPAACRIITRWHIGRKRCEKCNAAHADRYPQIRATYVNGIVIEPSVKHALNRRLTSKMVFSQSKNTAHTPNHEKAFKWKNKKSKQARQPNTAMTILSETHSRQVKQYPILRCSYFYIWSMVWTAGRTENDNENATVKVPPYLALFVRLRVAFLRIVGGLLGHNLLALWT